MLLMGMSANAITRRLTEEGAYTVQKGQLVTLDSGEYPDQQEV